MGNKSSSSRNSSRRSNRSDMQIPTDDDDEDTRMSYWQMAKMGYQELVNAIIRPPRANYTLDNLGPQEFSFGGKTFARIDYDLQNERGMKICCSHWQPVDRAASQLPCVIYMHGNSSARVEAIPQLTLVLSLGCTVLAFDFSGSGQSGGDHVSLGYFEREDLKVVIEHLRQSGSVSYVALWGRSMGAATALLHGDRDPSIAAMVLDSPFTDLHSLAVEMVDKGREAGLSVPNWVVKAAIRLIRNSVRQTAGFDIRNLSPIAHADSTFIPALFVAGEQDDFILPHHSQRIYERYGGDKNLILVEGDHNSPRPKFLFDSVGIFLQNYLQIPIDWSLPVNPNYMGLPPWYIQARGVGHGTAGQDDSYYDAMQQILTLSGNPELDVGMTAARQQEVEASLAAMLGHRGGAGTGGGGGGGQAAGGGAGRRAMPAPPPAVPLQRNEPDDGIRIRTDDTPEGNCPVHHGPWSCGLCTLRNGAPAAVCGGCGISREVATAGPEGRAAASAALAAHQRGLLNGQQEDEDEYNDTSQTNGDSTTQNRQLDQFGNDQENEEIIRNSSLVNDGSQQEPGKYS